MSHDFGALFNRAEPLHVSPCGMDDADKAVKRWHYSKSIPAGVVRSYGVHENGQFGGAVIYTNSNRGASEPYGITDGEIAALARVALAAHAATVTRIVAITLRLLKKDRPALRLVVSYADPDEGHHGGIYQGGNWIYTGTSSARHMFIVRGKRWVERTFDEAHGAGTFAEKLEWLRRTVDPSARVIETSGNHRYLYPLDAAMRRQIEPLRKPYPKRAESKAGVAPVDQTGEGGSTPTSALHEPNNFADALGITPEAP